MVPCGVCRAYVDAAEGCRHWAPPALREQRLAAEAREREEKAARAAKQEAARRARVAARESVQRELDEFRRVMTGRYT